MHFCHLLRSFPVCHFAFAGSRSMPLYCRFMRPYVSFRHSASSAVRYQRPSHPTHHSLSPLFFRPLLHRLHRLSQATCHPQSATGVQTSVIAHHVNDSVLSLDRHALAPYAASRLPTPSVRPPTVLHRPSPGSIFRPGEPGPSATTQRPVVSW